MFFESPPRSAILGAGFLRTEKEQCLNKSNDLSKEEVRSSQPFPKTVRLGRQEKENDDFNLSIP